MLEAEKLVFFLLLFGLLACTPLKESDLPSHETPSPSGDDDVGDDDSPGDDDTIGDDDSPGDDDDTEEPTPTPTPIPTPTATPGPDGDEDGYPSRDDCNDEDPEVNPGAEEVCDGIDNNCSGEIDEGVSFSYYSDGDKDGFGSEDSLFLSCEELEGQVSEGHDCDDADASVHPMFVDQDAEQTGDGTKAKPFKTIQSAVDNPGNCGFIYVSPGIYDENIQIDQKSDFNLIATEGSSATEIRGSGGERAIKIQSSSSVLIDGFAVTALDTVSASGAALGIFDSSEVSLNHMRVYGSNAEGEESNGGGVTAYLSSPVYVSNSTLSGNTAQSGGGLAAESSAVYVSGCLIKENRARDGGGGAFAANIDEKTDAYLLIQDSTITDNNSQDFSGGGVRAEQFQVMELEDTLFKGNVAETVYGGGAANPVKVLRCTFIENSADGAATGYGGGVIVRENSEVKNSLFLGNSANMGGGLYLLEFVGYETSHLIENNSFVDNVAELGYGSSVYLVNGRQATLRNNIMMNTGYAEFSVYEVYALDTGEDTQIDHNDIFVEDGYEINVISGTEIGEDNNIAVDPGFVSYSQGEFESADLHLKSGSECIDVGHTGAGKDPDGSNPDLGAYGGKEALP